MTRMTRLLQWAKSNDQNLAATLALAGLGGGFALWFPPLGLIVPSSIIFVCLILSRLQGRGD